MATVLVAFGLLVHEYWGDPVQALAEAPHARVLFAGDMMFDRSIREAAETHGDDYLFTCVDRLFSSADFVVANLEGPITENDSRSTGSAVGAPDNFVFTFPISTAALLYRHNVRIVNLGNNHIENFGTDGVRSTIRALNASGVKSFGSPLDASVATTTMQGISIAFINYNEFARRNTALTASTTIAQIKAAREAGELPIVYTHWGIEYASTAPERIHELAHAFVDAGAAAVVGSHPHVVEDHEAYKGVPIYYSLGNFIFDQYWNDAVSHGLLLELTITPQGVAATHEIPVILKTNRQTCLDASV